MFLCLESDIGDAWKEVSSSAIVRAMANVQDISVIKDSIQKYNIGNVQDDSTQISDLLTREVERLNATLQAMPKLDGAAMLLKEFGECSGAVGMEFTKLLNDVGKVTVSGAQHSGPDYSLNNIALKSLANGLLRSGRRSKRHGLEVGVILEPFFEEERRDYYMRMAMQDRKDAVIKRFASQRNVESKALSLQNARQNAANIQGNASSNNPANLIAKAEDELNGANAVLKASIESASRIARILTWECERLEKERRRKYLEAVKVLASNSKECCSERVAIWEAAMEAFLTNEELGKESL